jgi:hypothetical protein
MLSLVAGITGWLAGLPLLAVDWVGAVGGTAGVGVIGPLVWGLLSAVGCLLAVLFGIIALLRIRKTRCRGLGITLTGTIMGFTALTYYILIWGPDAALLW